MNVMGIMQQIMSNNRVMGNPMQVLMVLTQISCRPATAYNRQ